MIYEKLVSCDPCQSHVTMCHSLVTGSKSSSSRSTGPRLCLRLKEVLGSGELMLPLLSSISMVPARLPRAGALWSGEWPPLSNMSMVPARLPRVNSAWNTEYAQVTSCSSLTGSFREWDLIFRTAWDQHPLKSFGLMSSNVRVQIKGTCTLYTRKEGPRTDLRES